MCLARSHQLIMVLALSLGVLFALPAAAELYEWTDDEGRVHYSNSPRPGSSAVGLAPIALEPEGIADDSPTDAKRRERLKRQQADRALDSQDEVPRQLIDPRWNGSTGDAEYRPAAPAADSFDSREQECQTRYGMSCLRYEAWRQASGKECIRSEAGEGCMTAAEVIEKKRRAAHLGGRYEPTPGEQRLLDDDRERKKKEQEEALRKQDAGRYRP